MLLAFLLHLLRVDAILTNTGHAVNLNGIGYYTSPYSIGSIAVPRSVDRSVLFVPMTVLNTDAKSLATSSFTQHYAAIDDIFQLSFLDIALIQHTGSASSNVTVTSLPEGTIVIQTSPANATTMIPQGPCFCHLQPAEFTRPIGYIRIRWSVL